MSGAVTAAVGGAVVGGYMSNKAAGKAADASREAANIQRDAELQKLDYLRETDKLPQHYREQALAQLGDIYGLGGVDDQAYKQKTAEIELLRKAIGDYDSGTVDVGHYGIFDDNIGQKREELAKLERELLSLRPSDPNAQQNFIKGLETSPLYKAIMGTMQQGEDAIMRHAGATGGLRSGNAQAALASHAQQLQNKALLQSYSQRLAGLQDMAGLSSIAPQIGAAMSSVGSAQAAGVLGAGQAAQAGYQDMGNAISSGMNAIGTSLYLRGLQDKPGGDV